ncbi:MAG: protein kinase [Thermoflexaceae bacterium]|nr:protein kinase [Thermoflexaceae bacterium]
MPSERMQRRIDSLLDEAESAIASMDWETVRARCQAVLALDPGNADAEAYVVAAERADTADSKAVLPSAEAVPPLPASFVSGRYRVLRLLGEGARKRVYLAHDERLDRDVAFAVIRTEGLDAMGRERVQREARAMARIGAHPNLVAIHDIGEEAGDSYLVQEYMDGGDLAVGPEPMAVARVLGVAKDIAAALAFIHRAGVVHRDLKPANVFLAKDGTAKVGDFGLAMAADLSRITQHGTFVGTVAYMPPEQAVGGEVTAKSDLYSFGALLYEVFTGRPPFVGDDPTAIISQHLNTPPVAPSWHREDCPPGLERVLLRLLEKDPGKRPADAAEVLALLEKVDPEERPAPRSEGHVLERLARGVFVGREKELDRLRKAFDEALSGHGGLVMLVGEPGIGKTRTAQELETYARMRGAQVLWGRNHENSGAPAFWPWVQVGRHWGSTNDVNSLSSFLAAGGGDLARLFPELRGVDGFVEPPLMQDGAAAQFRLFDAFSSFVRLISEAKPTVITLDDLHWSDKPTLQLLQHLARELSRMRVLVVCTYRDTDLVRTHPLSEALANLNRDPGFERVVLRGLSKEETRAYIRGAASLQPSSALVERVYEETEGNPFFLSEVVNLLTQEGTLASESVSDIHIPDGVREALGRRLDRISDEATSLLQVAAVVGREFTYDTMQLLHAGDDDALLNLIEEGLEARVVEEMEQPGRYRFTHALMQETLLGELSTTRRVRLHGQVGEALERRWGDRAEEYASRLANHFSESAILTEEHAGRALKFLLLAGAQAESHSAFAEAVKLLERALEVGRMAPRMAFDEASALARLATNERFSGFEDAARRAAEHWRAALSLLRASGEWRRFADTCRDATYTYYSQPMQATERLLLCREARGHSDGLALGVCAELSIRAAASSAELGKAEEAWAYCEKAERLSLGLRNGRLAADIAAFKARQLAPKGRAEEAVRLLRDAAELLASEGDHLAASEVHNQIAAWGRTFLPRAEYEGELTAATDLALAAHNGRVWANCVWWQMLDAIADGRWTDCERLGGLIPDAVGGWCALSFAADIVGDSARALRHVPDPDAIGAAPVLWRLLVVTRVRALWYAGQVNEARAEAARLPATWVPSGGGSLLFGDRPFVNLLSHEMATLSLEIEQGLNGVTKFASDRVALLLIRLGRAEEAATELREGFAWGERERRWLVAARCLQIEGEVEAAHGSRDRALSLLDDAGSRFERMGAKRYLDEVIAKKVELQGLAGSDPYTSIVAVSTAVGRERPDVSLHAAADGTVTLMFSDIEGSTALNERLGDVRWMEVLRAHNDLVDREVAAHGGRTVKTIGDGYMVAFPSPEAGVRCALAIQAALTPGRSPAAAGEGRREATLLDGIRVRIGLHTGSAVRQGEDFFGREVNYAARVASAALGGEVLVSEVMRERLGTAFAWDGVREVTLKGFEGTHRVFGVMRG